MFFSKTHQTGLTFYQTQYIITIIGLRKYFIINLIYYKKC